MGMGLRVSLQKELSVVVDYEEHDTGVYSAATISWLNPALRQALDGLFAIAKDEDGQPRERIAGLRIGRDGIEGIFVDAKQPPKPLV
jgi:hypothetical protein